MFLNLFWKKIYQPLLFQKFSWQGRFQLSRKSTLNFCQLWDLNSYHCFSLIYFSHFNILKYGTYVSHQCHAKTLTGGNCQKWKRVFLTCPCHKIYRDEAVGLKSCKYTWKICENGKFGAVSWKFDILSISS